MNPKSPGLTRGRGPALLVLLALSICIVVLAAIWVPWSTLGAGAPNVAPDASADFTVAQLARDSRFHAALRPWTYSRLVIGLVVVLVLGLTPIGGRLVARAGRLFGGSWPATVIAGTVALAVVSTLVALPFSVGAELVLRDYGLSTQAWGPWLVDVARGIGVSVVLTAILLVGVVGLACRLPHGWWLPGAFLAAALVVAGSTLYPVVIEPLYNDFTPMAAGPQRTALLELAARDGQPVSDVLVADASRRTTAENAYVSGLGSTRRLVVYDTLLRRASEQEVELVVAHELGHVANHDVRLGTTLGALGAAWAVVLIALLTSHPWLLRRAGARSVGDPKAIAMLLALVAVGSYAVAPASNLISRRIEARADLHSLNLTRDPASFAQMQRQLAVANISDLQPRWYRELFFATHPSPPARVAMARAWARQHGLPQPPPIDSTPGP